MGENTKWHQSWRVENLPRLAHHDSGLSVRFDPDTRPLAWRMSLAAPLPAGYELDLRKTPRLLYEALRIWQAKAWDGRYLPSCVVTKGDSLRLEDVAAASNLQPGTLTQQQLDALLEQWNKAKRRSG